jgi:hypothetical protein
MAATLIGLGFASLAKTQKLTGKMVAYDLMKHNMKPGSAVENEEVIVLETPSEKRKYVKVMFSSFGTTQIEQKYFDGTLPLEVEVFRDRSCDEKTPTFVSQVSLEQIAGTYHLTDAFKTQPPARIKMLECYVAIYRKK